MSLYRKKVVLVGAEQYIPGQQRTYPKGVHSPRGMDEGPYIITIAGDIVFLQPNDWVVNEPGRGYYLLNPVEFSAAFEEVSEP